MDMYVISVCIGTHLTVYISFRYIVMNVYIICNGRSINVFM